MNALVPIVTFGWIALALALFAVMKPRRALIVGMLGAWMFLPVVSFTLPGLPDFDKAWAVNIGLLLGALVFDTRRMLGVRPRWYDLPMVAWCLSPFLSSVVNGLGVYDGLAQLQVMIGHWALPWWLGRAYMGDVDALEDLARGFVVSGLVYAPLCLWEIRMSPQLHATLYGFHQHDFAQTIRFGGFRPTVFMQHGLMVAMWMATATLMAIVLWRACGVKRIGPLPMPAVVGVLLVTLLLCKSFGAVILMTAGVFTLWSLSRVKTTIVLGLLAAGPIVYIGTRATGLWSAREVVELTKAVSPDRAWSLEYRIESEDLLAKRAREAPWMGWGGWGRSFVTRDEEGYEQVISDGLWIIVFGQQGLFGLAALVALIFVPVRRMARAIRPTSWVRLGAGAAGAIAILLLLFLIDDLANNMIHPVYMLAAGGLASMRALPSVKRERRTAKSAQSAHRPTLVTGGVP